MNANEPARSWRMETDLSAVMARADSQGKCQNGDCDKAGGSPQ
jgi:hypothetical protein